VLFSNVRVHSYCDIQGAVILPNVVVNRHAKLKNVVIDKGVHVPEGIKIGFDPDEDRKRFYVSEKGTVLVTREMLGQHRPVTYGNWANHKGTSIDYNSSKHTFQPIKVSE
jgi:ADP-glucose pyrophosphorylase